MKRIRLFKRWLCRSSLLCCLFSGPVFAGDFSWNAATHQLFEADFNQDGYNDLLLQAKVAGQKHYFVAGLADAKQRYDYAKRIELPQKITNLQWTADQVQLLPFKLQNKAGHSLLVLPKNVEKALLFAQVSAAADLQKAQQVYDLKQNKWLRASEGTFYYTGDFDGDGQQDLLQLDAENGTHQIVLFEKNQKLKTAKKLSKTVRWGLKNNERLIIRDFNQDGRDDVFALSRDGSQPHVLLYSDGKGGFSQEDGKFIAVNQANLHWTENTSGIAAVRRKSDNQTVLFRAYNSSERNKVADNCLGWVYDTQADTAQEYCPAVNKGNSTGNVAQQSDAEQTDVEFYDCPIEMSIGGNLTTQGNCDNGFIMPNTPTSAPQVNYGPHAPGAQINLVLANTYDYSTLEYDVWAQAANGVYSNIGGVSAPACCGATPSVSVKVSLPTPGTYSLMYRACNGNGCSGFGPAATVLIQSPTVMHTVSAAAGHGGTISPASRSVANGQATTFTVTPNAGYTASATGCSGNLSGTAYTTGAISSACTVSASFSLKSYTVSATAGANGSIAPANKTVNHGQTTTFTVTPNAGYAASASGCGGSLSGTTYTTGVITGACSVNATFTAQTVRVSAAAGSGGSISPAFRDVALGQYAAFTVTSNAGYTAAVSSGCGGSISGNTFTAGPVTANCTLSATFTLKTYTVSATAGANGSITPASRTVNHGQTTTYTVTPNAGYTASVSGCGGRLSGNIYTTGVISGACTVSASFTAQTVRVSATGGAGGSITPAYRDVPVGQSAAFTVTANAGYTASISSGCGGSISGNTFTAGPVTANCTLNASFSLKNYTVSVAAGANGTISPSSKTVSHGQTTTFTVTPHSGYSASVSGCGGTLSGTTYTTGGITGACTVSASFSQQTHTVSTAAGANGAISPSSKTVSHGQSTIFTVTPIAGYTAVASGCGGSLSGTTYATGAITGACTVSATFSAVVATPQVVYLHTDVLGSVIAETDANGAVIKKTEYKPFGQSVDN